MLWVLLLMTTVNKAAKPQTVLRTIKVKGNHAPASAARDSSTATPGNNGENTDQIGAMVNKGLDLAEVGIGLGVDIVSRLGSIFKDQVFDKFNTAELLGAVMSRATADQPDTTPAQSAPQESTAAEASATQPANYHLVNRLPLHPGSEVAVSFSINNDSLTDAKHVTLHVESFRGQAHQQEIDAAVFAVTPSQLAIAPADFEKLVLTGKFPATIAPDTYHGWIIVVEQQTYRIPVVLMVSAAPQVAAADTATHMSSPTT
jgi:hypothetical protein